MLQLKKRDSFKNEVADKEYAASNFIPYKCHYDSKTIITKDDELMQVIKLDGFSFETVDDEELDMRKSVRNALLKSMTSGNLALYFHTVRRKQAIYPPGKQPRGFARELDKAWRKKHEGHDSFQNELYVTIIRKRDTRGAAVIENTLRRLQEATDQQSYEASLREAHKELTEVTDRIIATLRDYGPEKLGTIDTPEGPYSEILEFLSYLVNCGQGQPVRLPTHSIDKYLPYCRLYFGNSAIEVKNMNKTKYAGLVSIKEYGPQTAAGMLDSYLKLPFELIISQSYLFINRQTSIEEMRRQQNRMINANEVAISQIAEINDALDISMSGHASFGVHHFTVVALADDLEELDKNLSQCIAEMVNVGINARREYMNLEPGFWAQLPGNFSYVARKAKINTMNLASFASMHNYPVGKIDGNHWGPAVSVFDTASGTPYFFSFHLRDVGHTTIIGPTGSGKTVLMNFLCTQAQKFNCRMFLFDKDRGADLFVRAIGGIYHNIEVGNPTGFNPLQLSDTPENRAFLGEWMQALLTIHNEPFTSEDMEKVADAINGNYKLKKEDRMLRNIAPFLGLEMPGSIAARFRQWHSDGPFASLFDNPIDDIDFDEANNFGFEMGDILATKAPLAPTLLYLFHKINLSLDGTPTMIVLDEAWALIDNPIFSRKIKDWLKTLRKLNAMVIFATQSVEDASKSSINDTLLQQTATQIFLPNTKATEEYRKAFLLTKREFQLIKETDPGSRFFLVKQGMDVVVARIDLSGMEDVIPVLSGRAETVTLADRIRKEHGEDPEVWLPVFKKRLKEGK